MNREQIEAMLMAVLEIVDYDLYKDFKFPEEPEIMEDKMDELIDICRAHLKKA